MLFVCTLASFVAPMIPEANASLTAPRGPVPTAVEQNDTLHPYNITLPQNNNVFFEVSRYDEISAVVTLPAGQGWSLGSITPSLITGEQYAAAGDVSCYVNQIGSTTVLEFSTTGALEGFGRWRCVLPRTGGSTTVIFHINDVGQNTWLAPAMPEDWLKVSPKGKKHHY
jgi:hypothetical protein